MPKIKIIEAGMESYTGFIGEIEFCKGVSVEELSVREVERVGAAMACRVLDKDGNEGRSASPAQTLLDTADRSTPVDILVVASDQPQAQQPQPEPQVDQPQVDQPQVDQPQADAQEGEQVEQSGDAESYSRADLEAIADKEGIAGLRTIGAKYGVRSNSISGLIDGIVEAQTKGA